MIIGCDPSRIVVMVTARAPASCLTANAPPKPIDRMTAAERAEFANDVMVQIAAAMKKKADEGK